MAHFAQLDENNKVIQVLVVRNEDAPDETTGKAFLSTIGFEGNWVQTSYNNNFRGMFADTRMIYDPVADEFKYADITVEEIVTE